MSGNEKIPAELLRDEYTDFLFDDICFGEPLCAGSAQDVTDGIELALSLEDRNVFLEGLAVRLNELGISCSEKDTDTLLSEIKRRYRDILGKNCPRTVIDWVKGVTPPGITNRANNYDVCIALEFDHVQTAVFFQKHFLSMPYNSKNRTDAVYLYCIFHKKPYSTVTQMLSAVSDMSCESQSHTSTSRISQEIITISDDDAFLRYLSKHYFSPEQQYLHAKRIITDEIQSVKTIILNDISREKVKPDSLNSLTVAALLGYKSQAKKIDKPKRTLPARFTASLPNDVTVGQILNGGRVSYEVLRKTLMLLRFYNFYYEARNIDENTIAGNLLDFMAELDAVLVSCGFAQIYIRHPFDCLLMYCANSYDPIQTMYYINDPDA